MTCSRLLAPLALLGTLAACASTPAPVALPPALALVPGEVHVATLPARGVQIYECRAAAAGGAAWTFVAPEAELFEQDGRPAGRHGAGPFWQSPDGSRVEATVAARADAPQPGTIPWLLLAARSTGGEGRFAAVTHIRRVNTNGGAAPTTGCDASTIGQQARISYTADYLFHTRR